jgi:hypothetical protein
MKGLGSIFALTAALVMAGSFLVGCKSTHDPKDGPEDHTSTLPWTRPESWEGNPMGGVMPGSR